jgi:hypothetical protein
LGWRIIRKKHTMLIKTIGLISTILGAYETEIIPKQLERCHRQTVVADGLGVSSVPKPIGPTVTVSTSNASNIAEGRFEGIRDKLEALGYTVSANGSSVYTADGQVAGENWSGSSTISNMLKENQDQNGALASINNNSTAKAPVNTQTFGALPDGVTQQMITDSQNDGEYGYYNNDGSYVPKEIDKYNGGGPDYSGVAFRFWWRRSVRSRWRSLSFKNRNAYW